MSKDTNKLNDFLNELKYITQVKQIKYMNLMYK